MLTIHPIASGSTGNAYLVDDGESRLLIEAGISWPRIQQATGFRTSSLAGCLVSHEHGDHSKAVKNAMAAAVDCWMSAGTAKALDTAGQHRCRILPGGTVRIGSWLVRSFPVPHDAAEPVGFIAQGAGGDKLLYLTDCAYCKYRFNALTHVMIEANYSLEVLRKQVAAGEIDQSQKERIMRNHMAIEQAVSLLQVNDMSRLRETWLLHLSSRNSDADRFRRDMQAATGKPVYIAQER